jgi:hypothetical protein
MAVNVHHARTNLSKLIAAAESGEEVIIGATASRRQAGCRYAAHRQVAQVQATADAEARSFRFAYGHASSHILWQSNVSPRLAALRPEKESAMTILDRLALWKEQGAISPQQQAQLASLARGEPFSLSLELNLLLYAGVLAFIAGLGWTVSTWSQQLGDVVVLAVLSILLAASFWYCFSRAPAWSPAETPTPTHIFDYVLYLGSLVWCVELAYLEQRLHILSGQWDLYLLATALLFFFLAYRFDNRFVLSLALSSLAGWFGLTISHWPSHQDATYRQYALLYSLLIGAAGAGLQRLNLKPHFLNTYLNVAANVLFWAVLSGVFDRQDYGWWFLVLVIACAASLAWGLKRRQFAFVAYAAVYGYVGVSCMLLRNANDFTLILAYFVFTAIAMIVMLVQIARSFGRPE